MSGIPPSSSGIVISLGVAIVITALGYFATAAYESREIINNLRKEGKPMPPFSWIMGHLHIIKQFIDLVPSDAVFNYTALHISRTFTKHHIFYLDFWPFTRPVLVVANAFIANQVTQHAWITKPDNVHIAFHNMTGGPNLVTMPEDSWKRWRSIFTPGFSPSYMLQQVPQLVAQGQIFCKKLRAHAEANDIFQLEEATLRLAIDVIGLLGLDMHFGYQERDSEFAETMRSLIEVVTFGQDTNPIFRWNPLRPFLVHYYGRKLNHFISNELENRLVEESLLQTNNKERKNIKSIVALALDSYKAEQSSIEGNRGLDLTFKSFATAQLRLFLVAGHDTTSSAITYTLHLLYKHPEYLARVRAEHDQIFGASIRGTPEALAANPTFLNQLPLTLAAIKETLRLFPPAGGIRMGHPDLVLTAEDGAQFPTANCAVWIVHEALHRNPAYWPQPNSFVPERWLVGPESPLYPVKGAWRAFEIGPHNCIGQTLAITEIKTILVMVIREFDINSAYHELDQLHPRKGIKTAHGERAYQVAGGGGGQHPADRYPCRVTIAKL